MENILLIQDDAPGARLVCAALDRCRQPRFQVIRAGSCAAGLRRLAVRGRPRGGTSGAISAVLVDLLLPDAAGMEIIDRLHAAAPQIPIVVLSSTADEPVAQETIQRGAQDFLLKERIDDYVLPKMLVAAIDRARIADALFNERERAQVTLNSIGDAVLSTDIEGRIVYLNIVAERLIGWSSADVIGRPVAEVFNIVDAVTRTVLANPMIIASEQNRTVGLPATCILIRRDGFESPIEDSSAPIHDRSGELTGAVMVFRDVTAARASSLQLAYSAQHDSLTDLPNRRLLQDRLTQAVMRSERHETAVAVLYLDLDRFKVINDSLGHLVGDRLLHGVAARLRECARASDTVSRLGGDEFVVLLPEIAHARDAAICADKILTSLRRPIMIGEHEVHVTASIGIAVYPEDGTGVEVLLQNADSAMYEAKNCGRDNYQFYRAELNASASERQVLENGLRHAIERREFSLQYQPIMSLVTGAVAGIEALIRWNHATLGPVAPARFILIAEESGLIVSIGRWVLREACRQARAWQDAGLPPFRLAVNISAVELRSPDFVAGVARILRDTGFPGADLELELTETFLMQDTKSTARTLDNLRALGVHLALDDFGTGYSSLSYMRRFPIDTLKVDQSFVRDLTTDADDASVVSAVIHMGRSLKMRVVAEGVETREQLAFLEANDCLEAQGYHFSRPLSADACAAFLRRDVHQKCGANA